MAGLKKRAEVHMSFRKMERGLWKKKNICLLLNITEKKQKINKKGEG